jgi:hypothetical protein
MSNEQQRAPRSEAAPTEGVPPLSMTISRGQAGIMAAFGAGLVFCAALMAATAIQRFLPFFAKAGLGVAALFIAWVGTTWIVGAWSGLRQPVLTLRDDAIVSHGEPGGDWSAPLSSIVSRRFETRTGVKALVLEFAEGRKIAIPETLVGSAEAFRRLGEGAGEEPKSL